MCQKKIEGKGLVTIKYCVDASIWELEDYIKKNKER